MNKCEGGCPNDRVADLNARGPGGSAADSDKFVNIYNYVKVCPMHFFIVCVYTN